MKFVVGISFKHYNVCVITASMALAGQVVVPRKLFGSTPSLAHTNLLVKELWDM
jgi:hypothetical protein